MSPFSEMLHLHFHYSEPIYQNKYGIATDVSGAATGGVKFTGKNLCVGVSF